MTSDTVCGALCGYVLVGVLFGHIYCAIESLLPGSFHGNGPVVEGLRDERSQHLLLTYFSLATLTTVAYGDIMPARGAARGLSVVEAVTGQFYLAVLIAELIGKRVSRSSSA